MQKRAIVALPFICGSILSCGKNLNSKAHPNDPLLCCGSSPSQMVFKSSAKAGGKEVVTWKEVTGVTVQLAGNAASNNAQPVTRTFTGYEAQQLVSQLNLAWPKQNSLPHAQMTGVVTVRYSHSRALREQNRVLVIQNGLLLQDKQFPEVVYDPGRTLNSGWLQSVP